MSGVSGTSVNEFTSSNNILASEPSCCALDGGDSVVIPIASTIEKQAPVREPIHSFPHRSVSAHRVTNEICGTSFPAVSSFLRRTGTPHKFRTQEKVQTDNSNRLLWRFGSANSRELLQEKPEPQQDSFCISSNRTFFTTPKKDSKTQHKESSLLANLTQSTRYLEGVVRQHSLEEGIRQLRKGVSFTANVVGEAVHVTKLRGVPKAPPAPDEVLPAAIIPDEESGVLGYDSDRRSSPSLLKCVPWNRLVPWLLRNKQVSKDTATYGLLPSSVDQDSSPFRAKHVESLIAEDASGLPWGYRVRNHEAALDNEEAGSFTGLLDAKNGALQRSSAAASPGVCVRKEPRTPRTPAFYKHPKIESTLDAVAQKDTCSEPVHSARRYHNLAHDPSVCRIVHSFPTLTASPLPATFLTEKEESIDNLVFMTFNVGLLEYRLGGISWYRNPPFTKRRLYHIAPCLKASGCDIVALQEVYDEWQADFLIEYLRNVFPYYARRTSGGTLSLHNGLMLMSRFPLQHTAFHPFESVTAIEKLFGSKGILEATVKIPSVGLITFLNIHLASGAVDPESTSLELVRNEEILQVLRICQAAERRGEIPVIIGDLNAAPNICASNYKAFLQRGWRDAFLLAVRGSEVDDTFAELKKLELWQAAENQRKQILSNCQKPLSPLLLRYTSRAYRPLQPLCQAGDFQQDYCECYVDANSRADSVSNKLLYDTREQSLQNASLLPPCAGLRGEVARHLALLGWRRRKPLRRHPRFRAFKVAIGSSLRRYRLAGLRRCFSGEAAELASPETTTTSVFSLSKSAAASTFPALKSAVAFPGTLEMTQPEPNFLSIDPLLQSAALFTPTNGVLTNCYSRGDAAVSHNFARNPSIDNVTCKTVQRAPHPIPFRFKRHCLWDYSQYYRRHRRRREHYLCCMVLKKKPWALASQLSKVAHCLPLRNTRCNVSTSNIDDPFCTRLCTWDPSNPLNAIGPHAGTFPSS